MMTVRPAVASDAMAEHLSASAPAHAAHGATMNHAAVAPHPSVWVMAVGTFAALAIGLMTTWSIVNRY
jgi:hypothetical protein